MYSGVIFSTVGQTSFSSGNLGCLKEKKQRHTWSVSSGTLGEAEGIDVVSLGWEMEHP